MSTAMVALVVAGPWASGEPGVGDRGGPLPPAPITQDAPADPSNSRQFREGTELADQIGRFEIVGQRWVFVAERGSVRLIGLENLNLERVARTVAIYPGKLHWKICGTVTEYRGTNYLLLHRAVVTTPGRDGAR